MPLESAKPSSIFSNVFLKVYICKTKVLCCCFPRPVSLWYNFLAWLLLYCWVWCWHRANQGRSWLTMTYGKCISTSPSSSLPTHSLQRGQIAWFSIQIHPNTAVIVTHLISELTDIQMHGHSDFSFICRLNLNWFSCIGLVLLHKTVSRHAALCLH